jgi:hypothetical protein
MGDKNPNWNGGGEYRKILSPDRAWREIVFERDNFTCLICGQRGGRLQAHHLDAYHWCVERRYDIDNGVTLCRDDHIAFHTMFGTKNTTQQDTTSVRFESATGYYITLERADPWEYDEDVPAFVIKNGDNKIPLAHSDIQTLVEAAGKLTK